MWLETIVFCLLKFTVTGTYSYQTIINVSSYVLLFVIYQSALILGALMLQKRSTGQLCNEYISAKMATFYVGVFKYWNKILATRTKDHVSIVFFRFLPHNFAKAKAKSILQNNYQQIDVTSQQKRH